MHILHVVGARPNFVKAAPVIRSIEKIGFARQTLVHTGQHYDHEMSNVFFSELGIPAPDVNLGVGSGGHAQQTANVMAALEPVLLTHHPDLVLVYGDVNSTAAAALVCSKLPILCGHVEAGLRSFDRTMPEEVNRVVTDQLADFLFTPSEDADRNLRREGIAESKIHRVGNVMIDSLVRFLSLADQSRLNGIPRPYALVTLHRPSNVDDPAVLRRILRSLAHLTDKLSVVFPIHPRTRRRIADLGIALDGLTFLEPLPYVQFLALERFASVVITDSGGVQEETTYLRVPCLTVRENTERPITVSMGTNLLVGQDTTKLNAEVEKIFEGKAKQGSVPPLWDGKAGERIAQFLCESQSKAYAS